MKLAVVSLLALSSCYVTAQQSYIGWPVPNAGQAIRSSPDANPSLLSGVDVPGDGRLFFNLLATTTTSTTTITSTCTVSTAACSGKKRSILWREEYDEEPSRMNEPSEATEDDNKGKREAKPQYYPPQYPGYYGLQPSLAGYGMPYLPPSSPYYNPGFQHGPAYLNQNQQANARLFFNLVTLTSTVTTTTTSRSTPSCSSSSSFTQC